MGVMIALLLYADDAALPADSAEDLQLLASLFEEFCNESRLFISTPKTFVTVFHPATDPGVVYNQDSVFVDHVKVSIKIYGSEIMASSSFKYLGVTLNSTCSPLAHSTTRCLAYDRAAHLLLAGLSRIPAFPHKLVTYLWTSLVNPVGSYGMELFHHSPAFVQTFQAKERKWWRKLLQVGGRSPNEAVQVLMGLPSATISWRARRAAVFLKLANAPLGSWRHLAFIAHHNLQSPWFLAARDDLHLILPGVRLIPTCVGTLPFLSSSGTWSDFGVWLSFLSHALPTNTSGHRYCPSNNTALRAHVRWHVSTVTKQLEIHLIREFWSVCYNNVIQTALSTDSSKVFLLAMRLQHVGPPLHLNLDHIDSPSHRAAFAAFICGDWFLGKHARNYFAKNLLPKSRIHLDIVRDAGVVDTTVCLACWHYRRSVFLEDEFHVACICPEYSRARNHLLANLPADMSLDSYADLCSMISHPDPKVTSLVAEFLWTARQHRRKLKLIFERLDNRYLTKNFACKRAAWRFHRKPSCRHGVLFSQLPESGCKCMSSSSTEADWQDARYMAALDPELKCIVYVPFNRHTLRRLNILQAAARQQAW